ncbi:MAG: glycosyl hydrolase 115 family protein [bacterium]|nr:glycosyl hydrolase 115 family protein [bacterium]
MNINTKIIYNGSNKAIINAVEILKRDINTVFDASDADGGEIKLIETRLTEEQFEIKDGNIYASDELGFIYGLLHISKTTLGIPPFWFWYDYKIKPMSSAEIADYKSTPARIRFRGWFLNDEILLTHWTPNGDALLPWKMAFEAILRCGGNMVIPDTQITREHSALASSYGLWLTHHHAEPLGADMFVKAYPDLAPSYQMYADKFQKLWEDRIESQKDFKVIWDLGFRGQGDTPFWNSDKNSEYDTDEKRGKLISDIIKLQYDMLHKKIHDPVCCTYLYGETMELYKKGCISLPEDIIKIFADNGYGKMVSRRIGMNNPRTIALPDKNDSQYGIYYHVSYCDLQSCSHITEVGMSLDFITRELENAFDRGADDYLIVNCSNIRPHVFMLAAISELWRGEKFNAYEFAKTYFNDERAADAFLDYAKAAVSFGEHEDEMAGDHFYNFSVRAFISDIMKNKTHSVHMKWATGDIPITAQLNWFYEKCAEGEKNYDVFLKKHTHNLGKLYDATIILHGRLHYHGYKGGALFTRACGELMNKNYINAYYLTGLASEEFETANRILRESEYGVWQGFYENECFADFKFTAYMLKNFMFYIRNLADGPGFWHWPRELFYDDCNKRVWLQMNHDNRDTDDVLFEKMKKRGYKNEN